MNTLGQATQDPLPQPPICVKPDELKQTVRTVIRALRHRNRALRVVVIGGLARMHYSSETRYTNDLDFLIDTEDNVARLKNAIAGPIGCYIDREGELYRDCMSKNEDPVRMHVNLIPGCLCPYVPPDTLELQQMPNTEPLHIPFVSLTDLIVFKIHACHQRDTFKRLLDAMDVEVLLELANTPLRLTQRQRDVVENGIEAVMEELLSKKKAPIRNCPHKFS